MKPYTYRGTVHQVGKTQTWPSGFAKRTLVLKAEGDGKYPDYAAFEFMRSKDGSRDGTKVLDSLREGEAVEVEFYLTANESKTKPGSWFSSNRAVKVGRVGDGGAPEIPMAAEPPQDAQDDYGDIPF